MAEAHQRVAHIKLDARQREEVAKELGVESVEWVPESIYVTRVSHEQLGLRAGALVSTPWILVME